MDVDVMIVKLKSNDGKLFQFTEAEASCSTALKRMLDSSRHYINCSNTNSTGPYIPLQYIDSKALSNVHQWCKMHCFNNAEPLSPSSIESTNPQRPPDPSDSFVANDYEITDWDAKFLRSFSEFDLLKLTNAANFLDVKSLFDACCQDMARRWEGMKVDEIRKRYKISRDFTLEEEIQLIQDNKKIGLNE